MEKGYNYLIILSFLLFFVVVETTTMLIVDLNEAVESNLVMC